MLATNCFEWRRPLDKFDDFLNVQIYTANIYFLWCTSRMSTMKPSLEKLNWDNQLGRDLSTSASNKKYSILPVLFLCYEESQVSSNLNSKQIRFHFAHPNIHTYMNTYLRAIAAILLVGRVERASTAARFWGRFELLKKLWKHAWAPHRHIIVIIKIIIINCSDAVSGWAFSLPYSNQW